MSSKNYKFEEYSLLDIENFLLEKGYVLYFRQRGDIDQNKLEALKSTGVAVDTPPYITARCFQVGNTDTYIFPAKKAKGLSTVLSNIQFLPYPKTSYYEESKKIYQSLVRKFGRKAGENWNHLTEKDIKDQDMILEKYPMLQD